MTDLKWLHYNWISWESKKNGSSLRGVKEAMYIRAHQPSLNKDMYRERHRLYLVYLWPHFDVTTKKVTKVTFVRKSQHKSADESNSLRCWKFQLNISSYVW